MCSSFFDHILLSCTKNYPNLLLYFFLPQTWYQLQRTLILFSGGWYLKNQDYFLQRVIASWPSQWTELINICICTHVSLCISLPIVYLPAYLPIYLPTYQSTHPALHLPIHLSIHPPWIPPILIQYVFIFVTFIYNSNSLTPILMFYLIAQI